MTVPVILYGSPVLRKISADITENDDALMIYRMLSDTLKKAEGIGLAAPQVNLLKRAFIIDTSPLVRDDITVERFEGIFINPVILESDDERVIYREGCLSIPGIYEEITRPEKILARYMDLEMKTHEEEFDNIKARIFQHEYDHLDGILFTDRLNLLRRKMLLPRLNHIKKQTKHLERIVKL